MSLRRSRAYQTTARSPRSRAVGLLLLVAVLVQPALGWAQNCPAFVAGLADACCCPTADVSASACCPGDEVPPPSEWSGDCLCQATPAPAGPAVPPRPGDDAFGVDLAERLARSAHVAARVAVGWATPADPTPPPILQRCVAGEGPATVPAGAAGARLVTRGAPGLLAALGTALI